MPTDSHDPWRALDDEEPTGGFGNTIGYGRGPARGQADESLTLDDAARARIWRRLRSEVQRTTTSSRRLPRLGLAALSAVALFASGIFVGRSFSPGAGEELAFVAEPRGELGTFVPTFETSPRPAASVFSPAASSSEGMGRPPLRSRRGGLRGVKAATAVVAEVEPLPSAALAAGGAGALEAPTPRPSAEPPEWQRLANRGDYEAALFELGQRGGFEAELARVNAEQLMLLADVARATGQTQRALSALRRVVGAFPEEPVAPLAAWSLANLLDKAGDIPGAQQAFATYRRLSPQGDFAEDALIRQLRSAVERRDVELAQRLAAQYEADFPDGEGAEDIGEWLSTLVMVKPAMQDGGAPEAEPSTGAGDPLSDPVSGR